MKGRGRSKSVTLHTSKFREEPDLIKTSTENNFIDYKDKVHIEYAASKATGLRKSQEDFFDIKHGEIEGQKFSFFCIFDGHSGAEVARYLSSMLYFYLLAKETQKAEKLGVGYEIFSDEKVIKDAFIKLDERLKERITGSESKYRLAARTLVKLWPGSTCTLVLLVPRDTYMSIICANSGDSRAIYLRKLKEMMKRSTAGINKLSYDHDLNNKKEIERLESLIKKNKVRRHTVYSPKHKKMSAKNLKGKYFATLSPSRGFGDYEVDGKGIYMTAEPEIVYNNNYEYSKHSNSGVSAYLRTFIVIASDGLFNSIDNYTTTNFVNRAFIEQKIKENYEYKRMGRLLHHYEDTNQLPEIPQKKTGMNYNPLAICDELIDHCLTQIPIIFGKNDVITPVKAWDNASVILIQFEPIEPKTKFFKEKIGVELNYNEESESESEDEWIEFDNDKLVVVEEEEL